MTHPFVVFLNLFLLAEFLLKLYFTSLILILFVKGPVMQIEKALINDRFRVLKVSWKFRIPIFAILLLS